MGKVKREVTSDLTEERVERDTGRKGDESNKRGDGQ
jgi:hypothetical protein